MATGKAEYPKVVLTMVRLIWSELKKVQVEMETKYGSDEP